MKLFTRPGLGVLAVLAAVPGLALADFTDVAPNYVDLKPLSALVDGSPKSCGPAGTLNIGMFDWGGDYIPVHANGGLTTDPDSNFALFGIDTKLFVQNDLVALANAYMDCSSPILRVTQAQSAMLASITEANDETNQVGLFKLTWSQGDHLVGRAGVTKANLCDQNIAIMQYGPHVSFMGRALSDAGCDVAAMQSAGQIKWTPNLTGADSPYHALVSDPGIGAAFVVTPDMINLVDEGHSPGSTVIETTQVLSKVISDGWVVRKDFFLANPDLMQNIVHALLLSSEEIQVTMNGVTVAGLEAGEPMNGDQALLMQTMADVFPINEGDPVNAAFLYLDADVAGYPGNVQWATETNPRGWLGLNNEVFATLKGLGLTNRVYTLANAALDYSLVTEGLENTSGVELPAYDVSAVAAYAAKRQRLGTLDEGDLPSFIVYFDPDTNTFVPDDADEAAFLEVIDYSSAYGNALFTVEGNADPLGYLMALDPAAYGKPDQPAKKIALKRQRQTLRGLAASRAQAVQNALIAFAKEKGVTLDPSQFAVISHGIDNPANGFCDDDGSKLPDATKGTPCSPADETEWKANMRVEFRMLVIPAEAKTFVARK